MLIIFKEHAYKGKDGIVALAGNPVEIDDTEAQGYIAVGMAEAAPAPEAAPEPAAKTK